MEHNGGIKPVIGFLMLAVLVSAIVVLFAVQTAALIGWFWTVVVYAGIPGAVVYVFLAIALLRSE